jgi:hypothetical protein
MILQSDGFTEGGVIPSRYTCDGENVSPYLRWAGAPAGTKSFALSCLDPDAPAGTWAHWVLINIHVAINEILCGSTAGIGVLNDSGVTGYDGPCPPSGTHRYIFTVYALDCEILPGITRANFEDAVRKHTVQSAQLMGLYQCRR